MEEAQQPAGSGVACSMVNATRNWCFFKVVKCQIKLRSCQCCFSKLGEFTPLVCVVLCTLVQLEALNLLLGVRMCGRCVWSSMDWQPARDSVFSVAGMDMHRITDSQK